MAAILTPPSFATPTTRNTRRLVARPEARRSHGPVRPLSWTPRRPIACPTPRLTPEVYWRRRVGVALVLFTVLVLLVQLATMVMAGRATTEATPAPVIVTAPVIVAPVGDASTDYVVRAGDTLWSIAARVAPDDDPRPIVDALELRTGGRPLQPGQHLGLDGFTD